MLQQREIALEESMDGAFIKELSSLPGGDRIKECIQCGTCSGSCPVSFAMDYTPRRIISMIRAGMRDHVLSSNTIWMCTSCYLCAVRCPQEIKITDVMYSLKRLAFKESYARRYPAQILSQSFVNLVNTLGRNHEQKLIQSFILKVNPLKFFGMIGIGLKLIRRGRLPFRSRKIKNIDQLDAIIRKVNEMEGV